MSHLHAVSDLEVHLIEEHGIDPNLIVMAYEHFEDTSMIDDVSIKSHDFMHAAGFGDHVHEDAELYTGTET